MAPDAALDGSVRRTDEDRWLASRFASRHVRPRLIAVYALNHEIARARMIVSEPALGQIRLAWWREAIAAALNGEPATHPALQAIAAAHAEAALPLALIERLIDAYARESDAAPPETALDDYMDATAGGVMRLALAAAGALTPALEPLIADAARAWGTLRLASLRGGEFLDRARSAYARVRGQRVATEAFPALGYVALTRSYLETNRPSLLRRQITLIGAAAHGRL